ncbi:hypothetical protein FNV62_43050 [Streptomyces sp. RLB3-17]|uniref:hypothetical protein n=1 Tax=unclassified Streptomyces TaxID=2593676 RepID=UPI0011637C1C|nr:MULTISPECIES: hypothetical protein [unclassified Streptomyces]NMI62368.1 hypothetical protein [Streptomyces sp. RLA2-12]QDN61374.1 hypothetical protein FNV67_44280 [Streptomyces sp. S1D4-20]QDN71427.1 hypothetical protein FNV66_43130 [Streptomyces sp. S1D4-14]QDO43968.1 hypothetical protein FNV62_43050 [Streptomyces sp. RLB3-17]QDO53883.1 hypothetical protein FNV60_41610 [Streptomyces sp. RLB3-5]
MVHVRWRSVQAPQLPKDCGPAFWLDEFGPLPEHFATSLVVDRGAFVIEDVRQQDDGAQDFDAGLVCVKCPQRAGQGLHWNAVA